jgi:hypothetical protein
LVPSDWKKGLEGSTTGPPVALITSPIPERLSEATREPSGELSVSSEIAGD